MNDYKTLSIRYLQNNKKRSLSTIIGVALTTIVVFTFLNTYLEFFTTSRDKARAENNYDMVFMTEDDEQIRTIVSFDFVKDVYVGDYVDEDTNDGVFYDNATYITVKNPYYMCDAFEYIEQNVGVEGKVNEDIAQYYFQDDEGSMYVMLLFGLFISVIMAFVGVGIVRNSLQLFTFEQISDYGVLRCIGATKKQLKNHIYLMGLVLEGIGVLVGFVIGFIISVSIAIVFNLNIGLYMTSILLVLVAFFGDLYFVMKENVKIIDNLSPVEAVRGEYKPKKEKIKVRRKSIFGFIFGLEGDYAYKNLMRDKTRFFKTVSTISFGIAGVIAVSIGGKMVTDLMKSFNEMYGDNHQVQLYEQPNALVSIEDVQAQIISKEDMETIAASKYVTDTKLMYVTGIYPYKPNEALDKLSDEYKENTTGGRAYVTYYNDSKNNEVSEFMLSEISLYGYDVEEYNQLEDYLIKGTTDISENGIIVVQGENCTMYNEEDYLLYEYVKTNTYELGDEVVVYDIQKVYERFKNLPDIEIDVNDENYSQNVNKRKESIQNVLAEMKANNEYKTYVVEGIVKQNLDPNLNMLGQGVSFIMPLEHYLNETGYTDSDVSGVKYHYKGAKLDKSLTPVINRISESDSMIMVADYFYMLDATHGMYIVLWVMIGIITFMFCLSSINIVNTISSNMHIRKKELAQLRVIGMSKKRLYYTVVLEGVITGIISNVIGTILGILAASLFVWAMMQVSGRMTGFPVTAFIICLVVTMLVLLLSYYLPIRNMKNDMAKDLMASGE